MTRTRVTSQHTRNNSPTQKMQMDEQYTTPPKTADTTMPPKRKLFARFLASPKTIASIMMKKPLITVAVVSSVITFLVTFFVTRATMTTKAETVTSADQFASSPAAAEPSVVGLSFNTNFASSPASLKVLMDTATFTSEMQRIACSQREVIVTMIDTLLAQAKENDQFMKCSEYFNAMRSGIGINVAATPQIPPETLAVVVAYLDALQEVLCVDDTFSVEQILLVTKEIVASLCD